MRKEANHIRYMSCFQPSPESVIMRQQRIARSSTGDEKVEARTLSFDLSASPEDTRKKRSQTGELMHDYTVQATHPLKKGNPFSDSLTRFF